MKEGNLEGNIHDNIQTVNTICCSKCKKIQEKHNVDSYDCVDVFISEGWYATERNVYCKTCNEKRKKTK